jgi:hypothetical protein
VKATTAWRASQRPRCKGEQGQRPDLHPAGGALAHWWGRDGDGDTAARTTIAQKKQRMENMWGCVRDDDDGGTCKKFPSLARWPASPSACESVWWRTRHFPLGSKAGETVLTLVAPSRSEGVSEEKRRGLSVWKKTRAVQGMRKMGVCAATAGPAPPHERLWASRRRWSLGRLPISFISSPTLTSPAARTGSKLQFG